MIYLFFASGPLHFINIFEFIKKIKIKKYKIFMLKTKIHRVNSEMFNTIKFLDLQNIEIISWNSLKIISFIQYLFFIKKIRSQYCDIKITFVISDFKYLFFHFLRVFFDRSNFILIDEGSGTIIAYKKYISRGIYFPIDQYKSVFFNIYKYLLTKNFRILIYSKFKIFSLYKDYIKDDDILVNKFENLKRKIKRVIKKDNSIVLFVGTKLSERGIISLEEELKILKKINSYWSFRGKKLIYISKRTTSDKKLNLIKKKLSIDYVKFSLPLELAISEEFKKLPFAICSHGSALDITLKQIYNIKSYLYFPKGYEKLFHLDYSNNYIIVSKSEIISI
jgi:hypothetical protein